MLTVFYTFATTSMINAKQIKFKLKTSFLVKKEYETILLLLFLLNLIILFHFEYYNHKSCVDTKIFTSCYVAMFGLKNLIKIEIKNRKERATINM